MTMLQLNPTIPVTCDMGAGYALAILDYSQDHDLLFLVALNETGELWCLPNHKIRMQKNISLGRMLDRKQRDGTVLVASQNARL